MTVYSVYLHPRKADIVAVPDRFSWFAALLPPVYALVHGLWLAFLVQIIAVLLLSIAAPRIEGDGVFWLYVILAAAFGFAGAGLRRSALLRHGYVARGDRIATQGDVAAAASLARTPAQ